MTNKSALVLAAVLISFLVSQGAQAAVGTSTWSFNNPSATSPYAPDTADPNLSSASLATAALDGTSVGLVGGGIGGASTYFLRYGSTSGGAGINGSTLTFTLTANAGVNLSFTTLSFYYGRFDATAPTTINWSWSISGGGSGNLTASDVSGTSGTTGPPDYNLTWSPEVSVDLSGITVLSGGESLVITGTLAGGTGNSSYTAIGFDDISITSVPEPAHYALAVFGLVFVSTGVGRWYQRRAKGA